jgi:hypothetical protein
VAIVTPLGLAIVSRTDGIVWKHVCALSDLRERLGAGAEYLSEAFRLGADFERALYDRAAEVAIERDRIERLAELLRSSYSPEEVAA